MVLVAGVPTAEARVRYLVIPCKICGGQCGTRTDFSQSTGTSVFPSLYHSTNAQFSSSLHIAVTKRKKKEAKLGNIPKSNGVSKIVGQWIGKPLVI